MGSYRAVLWVTNIMLKVCFRGLALFAMQTAYESYIQTTCQFNNIFK